MTGRHRADPPPPPPLLAALFDYWPLALVVLVVIGGIAWAAAL